MIETIQLRLKGFEQIPPIDLRLTNGRTYGLFDAGNGAASALLAALAGAELPAEGSVRIGGFDTAREPVSAGKCVGYAAADAHYYGHMTVWDLLCFVSDLKGASGTRAEREIHTLLERLELDGCARRLVGKLTTDERRRVGLAQALIGESETILLDHPTKGLRADETRALRADISEVAASGKTVFLVSDSAEELEALCDRILFVDECGALLTDKEEIAQTEPTSAVVRFRGGAAPNEAGEERAE